MSSADMSGQIDVSRHLWKNAVGDAEPVSVDGNGNPLCPMCRTEARQQELHLLPEHGVWACHRHHRFQGTELSDEGQQRQSQDVTRRLVEIFGDADQTNIRM